MQRTDEYLKSLVLELSSLPTETGWVEFKINNSKPDEIGEYISALSNSAAIEGKLNAYMVWGVENITHNIIGTDFNPKLKKMGGEELENWLLRLLSPKQYFRFYEFEMDKKKIVILEIERASHRPIQFKGTEYIRVGSYKKMLKDHPEIERELWRTFDITYFEEMLAMEHLDDSEVLKYLDYPKYFELLNIPLP